MRSHAGNGGQAFLYDPVVIKKTRYEATNQLTSVKLFHSVMKTYQVEQTINHSGPALAPVVPFCRARNDISRGRRGARNSCCSSG